MGSVFDLLDLRPFQNLHLIPTPAQPGVDATKGVNVHSIAIQVPKTDLTVDGSNPADPASPKAVIGAWAAASRQKTKFYDVGQGKMINIGPFVQVSRLGNPLINEVIIPLGKKDLWNSLPPSADSQFLSYVQHPEVAGLLPTLYPGVFPNLAGLTASRDDLVAILMTGVPSGIIPGFQNFTSSAPADMLRLNLAIPPTSSPNFQGVLGGDLAGYPNGRRVFDDVVTIELRAVAGVTYPLVNPSYTPDAAASQVTDFTTYSFLPPNLYLSSFPYLGVPYDGYDYPAS